MIDKAFFRAELARARERLDAGDHPGARAILEDIRSDPAHRVLGEETALGLPRKLHAAFLRLAKREGDRLSRIGLQHLLVPPAGAIDDLFAVTAGERRALAEANRRGVPRVIHQVWIGSRPVPVTCGAWERYAAENGYRHRLWREADLAELGAEKLPLFSGMLGRGDFPGAVDLARYLILREEGGVYLDCDWYPAAPQVAFHDRLGMTGLTAFAEDIPRGTSAGSVFLANSFIAAPAGHPAMARLLAVIPEVAARLPGAPAWWVTGPLVFTLAARGGAVALADAGFVAGSMEPGASLAEVEAQVAAGGGAGMVLAWKPWAVV
ncbi:MAG: glycosyltransferase family 32 protein [Paracoccaceae bacterium]